jgi:hypothetical protein
MSETSGANKKPKPVNQHVRTFREGAVAANVFARQAPGGFEYLDFSLSRAWKSANGKEGYSQNFFASNRAAILTVIRQPSASRIGQKWIRATFLLPDSQAANSTELRYARPPRGQTHHA